MVKKDRAGIMPATQQPGIGKTLLLCLPMILITAIMLSQGQLPSDPSRVTAFLAAFIFINAIFFLMIRTGETDRWRAILFVTYAVCFVISFITHLIESRGSMAISQANMIEGLTPFCHIVIPMTLVPAALTKTIIFPGTIVGTKTAIASMFVLWIGSSLALGRGFCSWFCFFGGLDEGFSRLFKKARIKKIDLRWTYLPYAVLLLIVLVSAVSLAPFYCQWLCPFKTVTEYPEITSVKTALQAVIFISLFIALVMVLPALTKRRMQCGLFCPMGAFQSFTNKINVFEIRIDPGKCIQCKQCIATCPTFSMTEDTLAEGKTGMTCVKCGKCIDACRQNAISYHIKGTPLTGGKEEIYRRLFIYPAFIFLATMSGGYVQDAIAKTIKLFTTGNIF
ncbi:MAG: 4Fe-4S binding protein [Deltaproteobacteria bacterium]|nr:4Fe-4S binding protein [Deltaproteobacteria bacterium]